MTGALVLAALLVGSIVSTWQAIRATQAEQVAETAFSQAKDELTQKIQEQRRAEANFLKTLEAVDQLLTEVGHNELASMPHLEHVRRRLLEKALRFFEEFLQTRAGDPAVRFEAGIAYRRVGDIQLLLGQHRAAEKAYGQAANLLGQLHSETPRQPIYGRELGRVHYGSARLLTELGRKDDAEAANGRARKLLEVLVKDNPDQADYRQDLAILLNQRGVLLMNGMRNREAEGPLREGMRLMEELVRRSPSRADYHDDLLKCCTNLADLLARIGKADEAEAAYRQVAERVEAAIKQFAGNQDFRLAKHTGLFAYGYFLERRGRLADAEKAYRQAAALAQQLREDFPGIPTYRDYWVKAHGSNLGLFLADTGRLAEAEKCLKEARTAAERLAADFPTVPDYGSSAGAALSNLATLYIRLGTLEKLQSARTLLEKAIEYQEAAARLNPKQRNYRKFLGNHLINLTIVLRQLDAAPAEIDRVCKKSVDLARGLAHDYPDIPDFQDAAASALGVWSDVLAARGQWDQTRQLLQEAVKFQQKALGSYPNNPAFLLHLLSDYQLLTQALEKLGRPEAAAACRDWAATAKQLATVAPQERNWKAAALAVGRSLAFRKGGDADDYFFLARAHWHLGQKGQARTWYDRAVQWLENHPPANDELRRTRAEMEQLLGLKK
jgi:tetratricopeptide (TPR) repeat protein